MFFPLTLGDGMASAPYLSGYVAALQQLVGAKPDGRFGAKTAAALGKSVLDYGTWETLPHRRKMKRQLMDTAKHLPGFRGNLATLMMWEGHAGRPYWPGGASGITLDPGLDIAHSGLDPVRALNLKLTNAQKVSLQLASRATGEGAKTLMVTDPNLQSIRISVDQAWRALPLVAKPFWKSAYRRWPSIRWTDTPGVIHDAILSLVFNRGPRNQELEVLKTPMKTGAWQEAAALIEAMQQDHSLAGVSRRRREEAALITTYLDRART